MEVAIYGVISIILWISSASIFLPFVLLLKFSKTFRDRWFSFLFMDIIDPIFSSKLLPFRKSTFELLNDQLKNRDCTQPLEILEIGIGGGANLAFYPENSNLTALDMNESFDTYFKANQKKYPNITYKRTIHARAENMLEVADSSMDVVVCTFVLCSVEDIDLVLAEVKRVLKPGGKFVFLEHVAFPKSQWSYTVQRLISPLWHLYFDGCFPDRNIEDGIRKSGFSDVTVEKKCPNAFMLYTRPQILGVATK